MLLVPLVQRSLDLSPKGRSVGGSLWFVTEVPMLIPAGQTSWDNQLRVQGSDAAGNTLDYLVTVTRERPFVWAEIAEPNPPEAEPRQLVTFDGTASIVPALTFV